MNYEHRDQQIVPANYSSLIISLELVRQLKETGVEVGSTVDAVAQKISQLQLA